MESSTIGGGAIARRGPAPFLATASTGENLAIPDSAILAGIVHCEACSRMPLVGEWAILHRRDAGETWVCEVCERAGRGGAHGHPVRRERVRSTGGAINVRRRA